MTDPAAIHRLLDETVRRERGWLISSLVARLGPAQVDLAQDVAQDAIVKALSTWPYKGIPDNPRAWLRLDACTRGHVGGDRLGEHRAIIRTAQRACDLAVQGGIGARPRLHEFGRGGRPP